ncbi:MAG TPA: hypothetical protein ENF21_08335, partial [Bacteroidetes bacterium]|nr:hypothetical protein [Bacteroidota bacterium]
MWEPPVPTLLFTKRWPTRFIVNIKKGIAEGKALDMWQTASVNIFNAKIAGVAGDYLATRGSSVVVITSGIPRKPTLWCFCPAILSWEGYL